MVSPKRAIHKESHKGTPWSKDYCLLHIALPTSPPPGWNKLPTALKITLTESQQEIDLLLWRGGWCKWKLLFFQPRQTLYRKDYDRRRAKTDGADPARLLQTLEEVPTVAACTRLRHLLSQHEGLREGQPHLNGKHIALSEQSRHQPGIRSQRQHFQPSCQDFHFEQADNNSQRRELHPKLARLPGSEPSASRRSATQPNRQKRLRIPGVAQHNGLLSTPRD
jgi:hypothetical protein